MGDAYDNAMAESFFATLECELLDRRRFATQAEARVAILNWIETWYNRSRRHSALGYLSPIEFERTRGEEQGSGGSAPAPPKTMEGWISETGTQESPGAESQ